MGSRHGLCRARTLPHHVSAKQPFSVQARHLQNSEGQRSFCIGASCVHWKDANTGSQRYFEASCSKTLEVVNISNTSIYGHNKFFSVNLLTLKFEIRSLQQIWNILKHSRTKHLMLKHGCNILRQFSPTWHHVCVRRMYCWRIGCPKDYAMSLTARWDWQRIYISPMRWFMHYWCAAPVEWILGDLLWKFETEQNIRGLQLQKMYLFYFIACCKCCLHLKGLEP